MEGLPLGTSEGCIEGVSVGVQIVGANTMKHASIYGIEAIVFWGIVIFVTSW